MDTITHQCDSGLTHPQPIRPVETMPAPRIWGTRSHARLLSAILACFPDLTMRDLCGAMVARPRLADAFAECDLEQVRCELQRARFTDCGPLPESTWP